MRKSKSENDRKYRASEKGRACTKRYNKSERGRANQARFLDKIMNTPELRENRIERLKKWRENHQNTHAKLRQEVLSFFGNKCASCGIDDFRVLQIDHINGNGYKERKQFSKWSSNRYYQHILEVEGKGYQLLCANCNWTKRYERKEQGQKAIYCRVCGVSLENNIYKGQHGICKKCQNQRRSNYYASQN